jgi:hypothetical protein
MVVRGWPGHSRPSLYRAFAASGDFQERPVGPEFAQDLAFDQFVRGGPVGPPPAVVLHRLAGGGETVDDGFEVLIGVIQAEDQAAGADPA